jgi:hypothetical protein
MTEAEWLACDDPNPMLDAFQDKASARKLRLLGCACCRALWDRIKARDSRTAIDIAERFADGLARADSLSKAGAGARSAARKAASPALLWGDLDLYAAMNHATEVCAMPARWRAARYEGGGAVSPIRGLAGDRQAGYLRDIFGYPFRPKSLQPESRTPAAASLASAAYEERLLPSGHLDNARLAVLSDALEEAGCTDEAILAHLRSPGPHVRGCWALDLILGRS